jgi:hypothetical protein
MYFWHPATLFFCCCSLCSSAALPLRQKNLREKILLCVCACENLNKLTLERMQHYFHTRERRKGSDCCCDWALNRIIIDEICFLIILQPEQHCPEAGSVHASFNREQLPVLFVSRPLCVDAQETHNACGTNLIPLWWYHLPSHSL